MNQWCLWRAQQFRRDGNDDLASDWEKRADIAEKPDATFVWPRGFDRNSAVQRVQQALPDMPSDASDFWVLGSLNTLLDMPRSDAGGNPNHGGDGKFASGGHGIRRVTESASHPGGGTQAHRDALQLSHDAHAKSIAAETHQTVVHHQAAGFAHRDAAIAHEKAGNAGAASVHWAQNGEHFNKADHIQASGKAEALSRTAAGVKTSDAHFDAYSAHQKAMRTAESLGDTAAVAHHAAASHDHFETAQKIRGPQPFSKYR